MARRCFAYASAGASSPASSQMPCCCVQASMTICDVAAKRMRSISFEQSGHSKRRGSGVGTTPAGRRAASAEVRSSRLESTCQPRAGTKMPRHARHAWTLARSSMPISVRNVRHRGQPRGRWSPAVSGALQPRQRVAVTLLTTPHAHVMRGIGTVHVAHVLSASPSLPQSRHVDSRALGAADVR